MARANSHEIWTVAELMSLPKLREPEPVVHHCPGTRIARDLHRNRRSKVPTPTPMEEILLSLGENTGSRHGRAKRSTPSGMQAPDYSTYPTWYQLEGLDNLIAAAQANGDWEKYLGARGTD